MDSAMSGEGTDEERLPAERVPDDPVRDPAAPPPPCRHLGVVMLPLIDPVQWLAPERRRSTPSDSNGNGNAARTDGVTGAEAAAPASQGERQGEGDSPASPQASFLSKLRVPINIHITPVVLALPYGQHDVKVLRSQAMKRCLRRSRAGGCVRWLRLNHVTQDNLMRAVRLNDTERVQQLLGTGASPNQPDELGRTPLHIAAAQGYQDMVRLLLTGGARADPVDRRGNTPLHLAVCTSRWQIVSQLLEAGANVWAVNGANMTAVQLAKSKLNVFTRLKERGVEDSRIMTEILAVYDLVKAALKTNPHARVLPPPSSEKPDELLNVLEQIENLSISQPSLQDVSAELRQMSLTSSEKKQN